MGCGGAPPAKGCVLSRVYCGQVGETGEDKNSAGATEARAPWRRRLLSNKLRFEYLEVMHSEGMDPLVAVNNRITHAWSRFWDLKKIAG